MIITSVIVPIQSWASEFDLDLIAPSDLEKQLDNWAILDGRPLAEWNKGHLAGALSFSWEDYTRTDDSAVPYRVWPTNELAKVLGQMGIDENTPIVVYGDADSSWGGEGWVTWVLCWIGHKGPIRLLNGGIQAWSDLSFPLEDGAAIGDRATVKYQASERTELIVSSEILAQELEKVTLIDTRSGWEWFKGHIPEAIHIPWKNLLTGKDNRPISASDYRLLLAEKAVPLDKPMVFYCTGGIRSGYFWMVHQLSGLADGSNFEGGTEAWERRSSN